MSQDPVSKLLYEETDGVAIVTLNRPERLNALDGEISDQFTEKVAELSQNDDVRCVIITGAGRGFCAGGDLSSSKTINPAAGPARSLEERADYLAGHMRASELLHSMEKPTIAMINGPVAGAGVGIAGACDMRFAATSAVFKTAFLEVGLSGDYGSTWFWTRILGSRARDLFFCGEKIGADRALEMGIFDRVFDDDKLLNETRAIASRLAKASPAAVRYLKRNLNAAEHQTLAQSCQQEAINSVLSAKALVDRRKKGTAAPGERS